MKTKHIIIAGDPVGGLFFYGPFDTAVEAVEAAHNSGLDDWWVAEVRDPEELK